MRVHFTTGIIVALCATAVFGQGPPANDDCANASEIYLGTTAFTNINATTDGQTHTDCQWDGQTYDDVWFNFTAGATGTLIVSTCKSVDYDSDIVVYLGDDCGSLILLECNDDGASCSGYSSYLETPVFFGERITIRVGSYGSGTPPGSGTLLLDIVDSGGSPLPSPENDDCANAATIYEGETHFTTDEATTDGAAHPKCEVVGDGGVTGNDVWYTYTPSASGLLTISTCDQANYDTDLVIYNNSNCGALSFLACNDDGTGCAGWSSHLEVSVVGGIEHLIRVGGFEEGSTGTGILTLSLDSTSITWIGSDGGSWFDSNNWSSGTTPTATSSVTLDGSVVIDQPNAVASSVTIQNSGHLQVGTGTSTTGSLSTSIVVESGGILQLQNAMSSITSTSIVIDAGGQLNWIGGTIDVSGGNLNAATNISVGCFDDAVLIADYGAISATNLTLCEQGAMHGSSWTYVDTFTNHGTIFAGGSTNYTKIYGDYIQSSTGTLVTNYTSDTTHTWLIVTNGSNTTGTSSVEGTVRLVSVSGYNPVAGTSFEVIKSYQNLHSGTFDTIETEGFGAGVSFYQSENTDGLSVITQVTPIHYVDADSVSGDGTSWASAFSTLQEALAVASWNEQIWIAEGTYTPGTTRTDTFATNTYVGMYGGFDGTETLLSQRDIDAHPTILSGDIGVLDNVTDNVYHVVTCPTGGITVLNGITVADGNANGSGTDQANGAGIFQPSGIMSLQSCTIIDNISSGMGGGVYSDGGAVTYTNCTIESNKSVKGGGIYGSGTVVTIEQSFFLLNRANTFTWVPGVYGGGVYVTEGSLTVDGSTFESNFAMYGSGIVDHGNGGAIYAKRCNTSIGNSTFITNRALKGGAVYFVEISYNQIALIHHCSFERNETFWTIDTNNPGAAAFHQTDNGFGSASQTFIVNCLFAGNDGQGAPIIDMDTEGGFVNRITNCTVAHNVNLDTSPAIAGTTKLENCIIWHNEGTYGRGANNQLNGNFSIDQCVIDSWGSTGGGNITMEDPLFISPRGPDGVYGTGDENFRLLPTSPIIEWGDDTLWNYPIASVPEVDLDGNNRFVNDPYAYDWYPPFIIDVGCYEFQTQYAGVSGFRTWNYESNGYVNFDNDSLWNPNEAPAQNDDVIINSRAAFSANVLLNQDTSIDSFLMSQGDLFYFLNNNTLTINNTQDAFLLGHHDVSDYTTLALLNGTVVANRIDVAGGVGSNATLGINEFMTLQLTDGLVIRDGGTLFGGGTVQGNVYNSGEIERDALHNKYPNIIGDYSMVDESIIGLVGSGIYNNALVPIDYDAGNGYSAMQISGTATLGGTLYISGGGDTPVVAGQSITLLTAAGGINGTFDSVWAWNFPEDLTPIVSYVNNEPGPEQSVVVTMQSTSGFDGFGDPDATGITGLPVDAMLADINSDGYDDLVLSVPSTIVDATGNILIMYNNGNDPITDAWLGFSSDIHQEPVGVLPAGLDIGDMDGDGDLDIAVANSSDDTIDILVNEGTVRDVVTFTALDPPIPADYYNPSADVFPTDVALGNFSDDNVLDVAIANNGDSRLVIINGPLTVPALMPIGSDTPLSGGATNVNPGDVTTDKDFSISVTGSGGKSSVVKGAMTLLGVVLDDPIEINMGLSVSEQLVVDLDSFGVAIPDRRDDLVTADPVANTINVVL
ncbi:MAG: VCBS repeat-containing protein, partial [Planctomycetes bacterium]|nr:VCBS repeat-containing protein [Planctomycetota bacterium]